MKVAVCDDDRAIIEQIEEYIEPFVTALRRLHSAMETYLEEDAEGMVHGKEVRKEVLDFYFEVMDRQQSSGKKNRTPSPSHALP